LLVVIPPPPPYPLSGVTPLWEAGFGLDPGVGYDVWVWFGERIGMGGYPIALSSSLMR